MTNIKRAIIHVQNTEGLLDLSQFISSMNISIYTTGHNASILNGSGIKTIDTAQTGYAPLLVEKLNSTEDTLDLVIVDFPQNVIASGYKKFDFELETLIRFAIRNYKKLILISDPSLYPELKLKLAEKGTVSPVERLSFLHLALQSAIKYDIALSQYFLNLYTLTVKKELYPENTDDSERKIKELFKERKTMLFTAIQENLELHNKETELLSSVEQNETTNETDFPVYQSVEPTLQQSSIVETPETSTVETTKASVNNQYDFSNNSSNETKVEPDDQSFINDEVSQDTTVSNTDNVSSSISDVNLPIYKSENSKMMILVIIIAILSILLIYFVFFKNKQDDKIGNFEEKQSKVQQTSNSQNHTISKTKTKHKQSIQSKLSIKHKINQIPAHLKQTTNEKESPTDNRLVKLALKERNKLNFAKSGCALCVEDAIKAMGKSKYKYAIKLLEYSLKLQPEDTLARSLLSLAYHATSKDDKALIESQKALTSDPDSLWALLVAGTTMQLKRNYVDALKYFNHYLQVAPKNHQFYKDIKRIVRLITPKAKRQLKRQLEKLNSKSKSSSKSKKH